MSKVMEKGTEKGIFLDGREYTAADLYKLIALLVGNGVYANELTPTAANDSMTITHGAGHAWVNGVAYVNTTPFVLEIATADGALNRYDSLMLRLDLSINEVYAVIVQGNYSAAPSAPICTRNAETYDLKICDIYIPAGCTKITQDLIIDTRLDTSVCGVPVFPVEHLDMTAFYQQISTDLAEFKKREQTNFVNWEADSKAEIIALLEQLNQLVENDTVGELITQINSKLSRDGGTMSGSINMDGHPIERLPEPLQDDHAAPAGYVNGQILDKTVLPAGGRNLYDIEGVTSTTNRCTVNKKYMTILGVNRYDVSMTVRSILAEGTYHCAQTEVPIQLKAGVSYTMSLTLEALVSGAPSFGFRKSSDDDDNNKILKRTIMTEAGTRYSCTYTPTEDVNAWLSIFITDGTEGMMGEASFSNIMVEEGTAATEYEPYYRGLSWVYNKLNTQEELIDSLSEQVDSLYEIVNTLLEG